MAHTDTDTETTTRKPLDLTRLTLGEVAKLEDLSGLSMAQIGAEDAPQGKLLAAMVFVSERRRANPISWPDCLDLEMPQAMALLGMDTPSEDGPEGQEVEAPAGE